MAEQHAPVGGDEIETVGMTHRRGGAGGVDTDDLGEV